MKNKIPTKMKTHRGFTLIELLVVIAVIGILASIVLISLNAARNKSKDVRVFSSVRQLRSVFESGYVNSTYSDIIQDNGTQVANLKTDGPGFESIKTLVQDIANMNNHAAVATVSGSNVDLFTDGTNFQIGPASGFLDTGVAIFTTNSSGTVSDYAVYATTTVGYSCIDSRGNAVKGGEGTMSNVSAIPTDTDGNVVCK